MQQAAVAAPVPRNREPAKKPAKKLCKHTCANKRKCGHNCCKRGLDDARLPVAPALPIDTIVRNRVDLVEKNQGIHGYAYASTSHNGQTVSTSFMF